MFLQLEKGSRNIRLHLINCSNLEEVKIVPCTAPINVCVFTIGKRNIIRLHLFNCSNLEEVKKVQLQHRLISVFSKLEREIFDIFLIVSILRTSTNYHTL